MLAESQATGNKNYPWRRVYPEKNLFGHITGYYTNSVFCGSAGLESSYDAYLAGREPATSTNFVDQLLGRKNPGNTLQITIDPKLQKIAAQALGNQRGAVAAIDPDTGAAVYGFPAAAAGGAAASVTSSSAAAATRALARCLMAGR